VPWLFPEPIALGQAFSNNLRSRFSRLPLPGGFDSGESPEPEGGMQHFIASLVEIFRKARVRKSTDMLRFTISFQFLLRE
jgi:hypothetical protein